MKILMHLIIILFILSGCSNKYSIDNAETSSFQSNSNNESMSAEELSDNESSLQAETPTENNLPEMSIEEVIKLSKKTNLNLKDLYYFKGAVIDRTPSSSEINIMYYPFTQSNINFRLRIISGKNDGTLIHTFLTRMDNNMEVDIRNGNIEHVVFGTVSMADYLRCELPEDLSEGPFIPYMDASAGGNYLFLNGETAAVGGIEYYHNLNPYFEDGYLAKVDSISNHSSYGEFLPGNESNQVFIRVDDSEIPCLYTSYTFYEDNREENKWYAFWTEEKADRVYAFYLDSNEYGLDEFLSIVKTFHFNDNAFVYVE